MRPRRVAAVLGFLLAVVGLVGSAAGQGLSPITEQADALFAIVLLLALLVGLVVYGTLAIALLRFRASRSAGTPNPSHGNRALETAWSAVPALLLVGLTIVSTQTLLFIETNPENVLEIRVIGQQWSWSFAYPDGRTSNDLWLEQGVTFLFNVTSVDVIHSFYLPEFQIKIDAVQGMYNFIWLRPDVAGRFHTQCAEYCGLRHFGMVAEVIVFEPEAGRPPYGPPPTAPPAPTPIDLSLEEPSSTVFRVVPGTLNLTIGDLVRLRVWNNGTVAHTFDIDSPYNASTGLIPQGSFAVLFLNATRPTAGTPYGGNATDRAKGMEGTLVVSGGRVIDVEIRESPGPFGQWSIFPSEIRVNTSETVTFRIRNAGIAQPHNFTIGNPFGIKWEPLIPPGSTVSLTAVFSSEARAEYFCAVGGHYGAGMRGTLIVGNPREEPKQVVYPLFDFALATFFIGGIAGFGYVVHHAREGVRRPGRERER